MENQVGFLPHGYVTDKDGVPHLKGSGFGGQFAALPTDKRALLSKALPKGAIKQHPTKTFLSTIKAIFIVERLNDVFGINGWDLEHEVVQERIHTTDVIEWQKVDGRNKKVVTGTKDTPYILMKGRLYFREFDLYSPIQYGGHELGGTGTEPADGFKSAVTDLQSKCASYLEIGIQVFKGNPTSQEANESMRKVHEEEEEKGAANMKKKVEPAAEKKAPAKKKAPSKEVAKKVAEDEAAVAELCDEPKEEKKPAKKKAPKPPTPKANAKEEAEKVEASEEKLIDTLLRKVNDYTSANDLKVDAQEIVFNAGMDGLDPEETATLKEAINEKYTELCQ